MPRKFIVLFFCVVLCSCATRPGAPTARNVVLFIPDGLRYSSVTESAAPTMAALRRNGVDFPNSHSLFPTFTTPNASAMATGHYFGDTGDFGNTLYPGFPVRGANDSVTPFIEDDVVLAELDAHFGGNFLNEETLLAAARRKGLSTAAIGKLGPVRVHDAGDGERRTLVIDDATGGPRGIPLPEEFVTALKAAGLESKAPSRGENGRAGDARTPGTRTPNVDQQKWMADVATRVLLPRFKAAGKPFLLVFWSRDPDGTQHGQGDSFLQLEPGINGPTSLAAIRNADDNLAAIEAALRSLGLEESTDIVITADHGFSTVSKESRSSPSAKDSYADLPAGHLPPGFVAMDLARALGTPLFDPDNKNAAVQLGKGQHPRRSNGLLGTDPTHPDVVVAANGGSDILYLPKANGAPALARRIVDALLEQDYVSGIFIDDALGNIDGTLPLSTINLKGTALTPPPAIVVNFRSFDTGCGTPVGCAVTVADSGYQQGQGMHGSFSRADTHIFTAASGPSFRKGFVDRAPVSNADIGRTIARLLDLRIADKGSLVGRTLDEALAAGGEAPFSAGTLRSRPARNGLATILNYQTVGGTRYFDAAGFEGRTVGLVP